MARALPARLVAGLSITGCLVTVAVLSRFWTPLPPSKMQLARKLRAPLEQGLLGTDHFGRDVLSMLMAGAWNSLLSAVLAVAIGASLGVGLGLVVAARRGLFESLAMRGCDVLFAFPPVLSAMMLVIVVGAGQLSAVIAIAVLILPVFARVVLGAARQIWVRDYVLAARGAGKGAVRITFEHVLPNVAALIAVHASTQLGLAILTEAGLGFLGLGLRPPEPSWGRMLAEAQTFLGAAPWLAILPGLAIALAVLGFNLVGDGLNDLLEPRRRRGA